MALHRIYYPDDSLSKSQKKDMAAKITDLYLSVEVPKFFITVLFIPINKESVFVGGEVAEKSIQIVSRHFSARLRKRDWLNDFKQRFEKAIAPFIREQGFQWQIHLEESADDTWTLNGITPPEPDSLAMKRWVQWNRFSYF